MEKIYIDLVKKVLSEGEDIQDRTGTGTLSLTGQSITFSTDLNKFPLLTTKRMAWKSIVEELAFFTRGQTDANILREKNVHIWDLNGNRDFLDKRGLKDYVEYELGPVYGFQWRHFGGDYPLKEHGNTGFDQLEHVVNTLKEDPTSRRAMLSGWNPLDLNKMALPPCHVSYHFMIRKNKLCLNVYQRSADIFLGLPFNIASCALLTNLVAKSISPSLEGGNCTISIGDAHIYKNHVIQCSEQINREIFSEPKVTICNNSNVFNWDSSNIILENYKFHPSLRAKMAV